MPCFHPLQASFSVRSDGKKDIIFSDAGARLFSKGISRISSDSISLPCGRCMGCRLERSRQWAARCMAEAQMYKDNCFVTLTFSPENVLKMCPGGSLDKAHMQNFMKRLRQEYDFKRIRVFYCGEYGEKSGRPHYHAIIFNHAFKDKEYWKTKNGFKLFTSPTLSRLWPFGHAVLGDVSFETCAYVARYCVKKVTGSAAAGHYKGRLPEFCQASLKPGIGKPWLDKFGKTDVFPYDEFIARDVRCKPPRYFDKVLEKVDPSAFELMKKSRLDFSKKKSFDNSFKRLRAREKVLERKMKLLIRSIENDYA